ncbi:hypothetical protein RUM44_012188 [Polyplax serrata]|uniref:Uncharacterized protein n=1 Tax=Polyplax serrata TaxID=468196 RepID=A0ABR1BFH5_POLSC
MSRSLFSERRPSSSYYGNRGMGMRVDRVVRWTSQALKVVFAAILSHHILILITPGHCYQDAVHITAILGESVVFNCHVEFPGDHPVPYVLQWEKKVYSWLMVDHSKNPVEKPQPAVFGDLSGTSECSTR